MRHGAAGGDGGGDGAVRAEGGEIDFLCVPTHRTLTRTHARTHARTQTRARTHDLFLATRTSLAAATTGPNIPFGVRHKVWENIPTDPASPTTAIDPPFLSGAAVKHFDPPKSSKTGRGRVHCAPSPPKHFDPSSLLHNVREISFRAPPFGSSPLPFPQPSPNPHPTQDLRRVSPPALARAPLWSRRWLIRSNGVESSASEYPSRTCLIRSNRVEDI
jgi:hypothetical protein